MENQQKISKTIKFDMPNVSSGKYIFMMVAFVVVLVEIGFLLWFAPGKLSEINANSALISEQTAENEKLSSAVATLTAVDQQQLSRDLFLAESALPSEKRVTGLVSALTNLASESAVTVDQIQISFGNVSTKSGTKKVVQSQDEFSDFKLSHDVVGVPILMDVTAPDLELLGFVDSVQQALPLLDIRDVTLSLTDDGKKGQLSVLVFSQPGEVFNKTKIGKIGALTSSDMEAMSTLQTKKNILQ